MRIHDITLPVREGLPGWPGDTPYRFRLSWSRLEGATVNVGEVTTSIHVGTHVDAPFHFLDGGATVDALSLGPFLGPARVVDVRGIPLIRTEDLAPIDLAGTPRLLLRTDGWPDHSRFPESIPVLDRDVPAYLREQGVILLGLDLPSADAIDSEDLPIHHALGSMEIAILESVDLTRVEPGVYELIALPLKLVGADGSPVRAILRCLDS
jgi:arylformamidase